MGNSSTNSTTTLLGVCPRCDEDVPTRRLLIQYERSDGTTAFAECPGCREVVRPTPR